LIFWLNGLAGTGKSTVARTIAYTYHKQKRLGASFFFSRGGGDVGHAGKFFTSIAVQLADNVPSLRRHIYDAVAVRSDIASLSFSDQWRELVLSPLSRLDGRPSPSSYVLLVDALDECDNEDDIRMILQLLTEARTLQTVRLQIFLTSRPEIPIRHSFCHMSEAEHEDFVLHNISPVIIDHDISIFLEYNLAAIRQERPLEAGWPGEQVIRCLVRNASGLFIWAATACRFIREGKKRQVIKDRLSSVLQSNGSVTEPEKHLNEIYITVLRHSIPTDFLDKEKEELYSKLRYILGSIVVLLSPLSPLSLSTLLHISDEDIDETLEDLHAILDIPKEQIRPLHLHHPSFRDFLLNKDRCSDPKFWVDERQAHQTLADDCIQLMSNSLKQDVCRQRAAGTLVADVESSQIEQCLPPEVRYACLYWIQHLQKSNAQLYDNDQVHQFLQVHLLHWLEALGWIGKASEGILAIFSLEALISVNLYSLTRESWLIYTKSNKSPNLYAFVHDMKRFALYNRSVIEQVPFQLYCSALVFAPENSIIRRQFEGYIPAWIQRKPKVQANWSAALQTLEGHSSLVLSAAFSPDGQRIVSGSWDKIIRLWDAVTGAALQTLEGHSSEVSSIAFSPDGQRIVSGSGDKTVKLWDAMTGAVLQTLEGHLSKVTLVAFSPDSQHIVSGSWDNTIRLWDAVTGAALQTLKGHSSKVSSVAFSPDSQRIVSGSWDHTVRLWDAVTGAALQTLEGHSSLVESVAFSPDGQRIVSGSYGGTVRLRDAVTGAVSGSYGDTVRLWDAVTGAMLQTLEGHSSQVTSVAFSPDSQRIVSGSSDNTVRLWDAVTGAALQTLEGHSGLVNLVAFSPDGQRIISGSFDDTMRLWDAVTGAVLQILEGYLSKVISVAFSPDSQRIVSGSSDNTVRLWDAVTGVVLQTLKGHSSMVKSVAFSSDGKGEEALFVSNDWVVEGKGKILWLPPEYRATSMAIWDRIIVLGHSSGRISFLKFKEGLKFI
jgi:WD40 repeat protein